MINEELKKEFISVAYPKIENNIFLLFKNSVGIYEDKLQKDVFDFTLDEAIELFNENKWTSMISYYRNISILKNYVNWYAAKNNIDRKQMKSTGLHLIELADISSDSLFKENYFADFTDFKNTIETIYGNNNTDAIDDDRYLGDKSLYLLYWYDISNEQALNLKKSDINFLQRTITLPNGKMITNVEKYIIYTLNRYANADEYFVPHRYGNEKARKYAKNKMLFRTVTKTLDGIDEPVNKVFITNILTTQRLLIDKLPPDSPYYKKVLHQDQIAKSKFFCDILAWERSNNTNLTKYNEDIVFQVCGKVLRESSLRNFLALYQAWKKFYHS